MSKPVLLVEDDSDVREVMTHYFGIFGYAVVTAEGGGDALDLLRGGLEPCLIILDLLMPGMTGAAFRAAQMTQPACAGIPVVVMSGADDAEEQAARLGVVGCLRKPIAPDVLLSVVRKYCEPGVADA